MSHTGVSSQSEGKWPLITSTVPTLHVPCPSPDPVYSPAAVYSQINPLLLLRGEQGSRRSCSAHDQDGVAALYAHYCTVLYMYCTVHASLIYQTAVSQKETSTPLEKSHTQKLYVYSLLFTKMMTWKYYTLTCIQILQNGNRTHSGHTGDIQVWLLYILYSEGFYPDYKYGRL